MTRNILLSAAIVGAQLLWPGTGLTASAENAPPVAGDDAVSTEEDASLNISVMENDGNPNGDPLTITDFTQPTHGSVTVGRSLVGWWRFDETSVSASTKDSSPGQNPGRFQGRMDDGNVVPGRVGNALSFDGHDDAVTTGTFPDLDDIFTVSL